MSDEVITQMLPSAPRRAFGAGVLIALGLLLLYISAAKPPAELAYTFLLLLCGGFAFYLGVRLWQVTGQIIELTETELRMSDGTILCKVEDVARVDRTFFAFKPSNGFLITTKEKQPRKWVPGLWWRFGRRIGVGGVTPAAQGKFVADTLTGLVAQRDGLLDDFT